jgi:hypothetical protein
MTMQDTPTLDQAITAIADLEQQVQAAQDAIATEHRKANLTMRVVLVLLACMVLANLQFVYMLTAEFRTVVKDMVAMYEHFGRVADRMDVMTTYIQAMEQDMRLMPVMREQMTLMSADVANMSGNMANMTRDMGNMQQQVGTMDNGMGSMSQRFHNLNSNVGSMGRNVGDMADTVP